MWRLVEERVSARQETARDQSLIRRLGRAIAASLKGDLRWQAEEAGEEVKMLLGLDPSLHQEAWHQMKGCYRAAIDRLLPPTRVTLKRITAERVDLYSYVPPPGENISVSVEPFPVDYLVPTEEKIEWAVKLIYNHRSGGTSGMRAEHIKGWLAETRKKYREGSAAEQKAATEGTTEVLDMMVGGSGSPCVTPLASFNAAP